MLKARVYTPVSFSKQVFLLFAIIEVNNFIPPEGARGADMWRGGMLGAFD